MKYLFFIILFLPLTINALELASPNSIYIELDSNEIIFENNSTEKIKIASLTKIVTTITAIENIKNLDEQVTLTTNMFYGLVEANASVAGFKVGDTVTYRDLLYGTMLESGADATQALAILISGSEKDFALLMNQTANKLKLTNSNFTNSSGLDDELAYSTLEDISEILKYSLENETFKNIYSATEYTTTNNLKLYSTMIYVGEKYNINHEIIDGSKSGYTPIAGYCLSSISHHDGKTYMLITAGADPNAGYPLNVLDAINVYNHYFENYEYKKILTEDEVILQLDIENKEEKIDIYSEENLILYLHQEDVIKYEYVGLETLNHEVEVNQKIGDYNIYINDVLYKTLEITNKTEIQNENLIALYIILTSAIAGGIVWKLKK